MGRKSLYKKLIESGREEKCEMCGISNWQNKPITLQIHHKDGNPRNNDFSNLQILCPNCHSQTDNYCSKNRKTKVKHYCSKCGKEIKKRTVTGLCRDCHNQSEKDKSKCPSKEELLKNCYKLKTYSKLSKEYEVSDKTIKKWCVNFGFTLKDLNIKPDIKLNIKNKKAIANKFGKPIYQFDINHNFIKEFSSIKDAERQTKISASNIRNMIKGKRLSAGGFIWKYKYE